MHIIGTRGGRLLIAVTEDGAATATAHVADIRMMTFIVGVGEFKIGCEEYISLFCSSLIRRMCDCRFLHNYDEGKGTYKPQLKLSPSQVISVSSDLISVPLRITNSQFPFRLEINIGSALGY